MDIASIITTLTVWALPVLFAITLHEAGHAYVAKLLGDPTASLLGRVTMNPAKHIDPMGTVLLPLLLYVSTGGKFMFGYAKPVPVAFGRLRHPKTDMIWVALAGPMANLVQVGLWVALALGLQASGVAEMFFYKMCGAGVIVNIGMFAFNLFPLPPLDGGRILVGVLPMSLATWLARTERIGMFVVLALVFTGIIGKLWLQPIFEVFLQMPVIAALVHILFK
jgi:Zn-dependent protease